MGMIFHMGICPVQREVWTQGGTGSQWTRPCMGSALDRSKLSLPNLRREACLFSHMAERKEGRVLESSWV